MKTQRVAAVTTSALVLAAYAVAIVVSIAGDLVRPWELAAFGAWLLAFAAVGLLIVFRKPGNAVAWFCLLFALVWASFFAADAVLRYEMANPGLIRRPELLAVFANQLWLPGVGLIGILLLVFPDGRLPSPSWRWVVWLLTVATSILVVYGLLTPGPFADWDFENPLGVQWVEDYVIVDYALVVGLVVSILASAISVVFRYRRAAAIERLQLKWLAAAGSIAALSFALVFVDDRPPWILAWSAIPVAIGFAVLKYRLYDIDKLISRTVSYTLVAALLTAMFAGAVVLSSRVLPSGSNLSVAASTLLVAVVFNPLRRRVQDWVDLRFDRARFDAQKVLEQFADRLRNPTDIDELRGDLTTLVDRILRPTTVALWVRSP